ncbi:type VII secretion target [Actinoplanes couchii]|uniref:Excreted virulence factor EspC, type VII ESX diderm n=1 Tax=Actinoplanes couchii TaxID=403638 RepID=A0ABQ3XEF9_9ACTN|nr:type VII secretion target [Actinoplanes couchii]MDR6319757.1 hypothetical protein [Actinoplanes couchii]GID56891.1 hypothetical protein Aco03nite_052950 [Actinoplanes couchii]
MQPGFEVDRELLESVAGSVTAVSGTLQEALSAAGSGNAPVGHAGSAAATAARAAEQAWVAGLGKLKGDVETFGTHLATSAKEYSASDSASAEAVRRAKSESEKPR